MDKEINLGYLEEYFGPRNENETIEAYFSRCEKEINKIDAAIEKLEDNEKKKRIITNKTTMNTQNETRVNEQEYSNIKVSKSTAKVFKALADYSTLFDSIFAIDDLTENELGSFEKLLNPIRDKLDKVLLQQICTHQIDYTYRII